MKLKLNAGYKASEATEGFVLDSNEKYVVDIESELEEQLIIAQTVGTMGLIAIVDWLHWLKDNGFSMEVPNPTNKVVSSYYGKKPLWKTNLSQGIVVKKEGSGDYLVVMECSRECRGFKGTQIILTLGGCL